MRYASAFSGIGTDAIAWHSLGWECAWFAETDKFPCEVLKQRFPDVSNLGDVMEIGEEHGPVDLLVGGPPCQSFSVAGKRGGLDDPRGNMALEFIALAARLRARWFVFENVPGLLSSGKGRDFARILRTVSEHGYGAFWRVLDAQNFGVPQRRRRVFLVGYLGDWRPAAAVLLERESLRGDSKKGEKARTGVAARTESGVGTCGADDNQGEAQRLIPGTAATITKNYATHHGRTAGNNGGIAEGQLIPYQCHGSNVGPMGSLRKGSGNETSGVPFIVNAAESCAKKDHARHSDTARSLDSTGGFASSQGGTVVMALHENQRGEVTLNETAGSLKSGGGKPSQGYPAIAFTERTRAEGRTVETQEEKAYALLNPGEGGRPNDRQILTPQMAVRRLTPRECERLQGIPDGHTEITWRGKPPDKCPDGPRYRAIGNGMAAPCLAWIGQRIQQVEDLING